MSLFDFANCDVQNYSFQKRIQHSEGNNVLDATASSIHAFLCRGTCISSTQLNSCKDQTQPISPLKNLRFRNYSFAKLTQFSQEKSELLTWMVFFGEIHVFIQLSWIGVFGTKWVPSTLKIEICRVHSFQKLTEFSEGRTGLDVLASNIDGFLWRDTCVSSTQLNRPN
jgi:hypothetical protein